MPTLGTRPDVLVITRGHLHPLPDDLPPADLELDLRRLLADPAHVPHSGMRDRTGLQPDVHAFVLATRGARRLVRDTARLVRSAARVKPLVVIYVGCAGGKHRAAAIGLELAARLARPRWRVWRRRLKVELRHLHVHLPRVIRDDELHTA